MTGDEPGFVITLGELDERHPEFLNRAESPDPQQILLQGADEALGDPLPSGSRTKEGDASIPKHLTSD